MSYAVKNNGSGWRAVNSADDVAPDEYYSEAQPAPGVVQFKSAKIAEINAACAAEITGGFSSSALGAAHTYDSTLEDQLNLIGAAGLGIDLPYTCTDVNGVKARRNHTAAQIAQVMSDGAAIKLAALGKAAGLKDAVAAAADVAAVEAVVW